MSRTEPTPRKGLLARGLHWPLLVVLVFLGNIGLAAVVVVLANTDPSFAVEPDYYEKAVAWNEEIDQRSANRELGWTLAYPPRIAAATGADAEIVLTLTDRDGSPLEGAELSMVAFPVARAHSMAEIRFDVVAPGRYAARLTAPRHGRWELRVRATRGDNVFTHRASLAIGKG